MPAPGYYKTSYRALRLREMVRWFGLKHGLRNYLKSRFATSSTGGSWMPGLWTSSECKAEDLSEEFRKATKPHRKNFEQAGFAQCRLAKSKSLNPRLRDSGSVFYLDSTRRYFGQIIFLRQNYPSLGRETNEIQIAVTAVFEDRSFTCTNAKKTFDPLPETEVLRLNSYDVNFIYRKFLEALQQHNQSPRQFTDLQSLRQWFDARQQKAFEERVRRGLFVRMTDQEVAAAKARLDAGVVTAPSALGRRNLRWAMWLAIIGGIWMLQFFRSPDFRHSRDTIEYRGQEFKMSRPYADYEEYKDDPNNLDTNELDRIEQAMVSAQVPESFKDRREFFHFMLFDLTFPGYGEGGLGADTNAADGGSTLLVEFVEIPQRNKDRVLAVRQSGGELRVIDDFVYSTATNQIENAKLQSKVLRYYDSENRLIREKHL